MRNDVFSLKKQPGFHVCEQKAVLFDVGSDGTLFQIFSDVGLIKKKKISDNKTWDGEGVDTFLKRQKKPAHGCGSGTHSKHGGELSCHVHHLQQETMPRLALQLAGGGTHRCLQTPHPVIPAAAPTLHLSSSREEPALPGCLSSPLLRDDSFTDNWKPEFLGTQHLFERESLLFIATS